MNAKGQGALEYLLIIGGAVIVAGIVLTMLITTAPTIQGGTNKALADADCAKLEQTVCGGTGAEDPDGAGGCAASDCIWSTTAGRCVAISGTRTATCFP